MDNPLKPTFIKTRLNVQFASFTTHLTSIKRDVVTNQFVRSALSRSSGRIRILQNMNTLIRMLLRHQKMNQRIKQMAYLYPSRPPVLSVFNQSLVLLISLLRSGGASPMPRRIASISLPMRPLRHLQPRLSLRATPIPTQAQHDVAQRHYQRIPPTSLQQTRYVLTGRKNWPLQGHMPLDGPLLPPPYTPPLI